MSADVAGSQSAPLEFLKKVPLGRLFLIGFGLMMMIVVTVVVLRISQSPSKQMLFTKLDPQEVPLILEVLEGEGVDYELQGKDTVLVPAKRIGEMKMTLAAKGLPRGGHKGYDVISKQNDVYGKTEMEQYVLYKQAYEQEIESAIKTLDSVKVVKVLLAIPKSNRLLRNKGKVKASVTVVTWDGEELSKDQVNGIVKIVVDSVPELDKANVTVVDRYGKQLNVTDERGAVASQQLEYTQTIEERKIKKITEMVESFVGVGNVKVAVTADVDFTHKELRKDDFDSTDPSVRSQQTMNNTNGIANGGVPGAMANQPAAAGMAPEQISETEAVARRLFGTSEQITNYEVDKATTYEVSSKGRIQRLTVSVVVNKLEVDDGEGGVLFQNRTLEELNRIESLVKAAVGFEESRGDVLFVSNEKFDDDVVDVLVSDESPKFWEQAWLGDAINQVLGLVFICLVFFGILRPILKSTSRNMDIERAQEIQLAQERERAETEARRRAKEMREADTPEELLVQHRKDVDNILSSDKKMTHQILKHWMSEETY
ncbi:flagellar basal-body MS-ring/collar protein FliF [Alteromonas macleodii]|uniref:flagellar basal-body MS-ring/collar protein FliF n=1 Tax=Alteromonas macleodii TaxID=28108 RepID=UPI003140725E|tara:strand:+ start:127873 stop:129498 length:1626 start_codon:yes stop_codon:yes gene_type:complete